ncbi:hypothetical protein [Rahnella inusitata]|uniref:hypothetical protein n=1 Tax=Rahnella inusitata TaxID=58169 RepID=UPI001BC83B7D|nr:hypothetical protein [Rahnella inusitata]QUT14096.1 hypothetical protein I2123_15495 [Rahnella inusitata]
MNDVAIIKTLLQKYSKDIYSLFTLLQAVRDEVNIDPEADQDLKIDSLLLLAQFVVNGLGEKLSVLSGEEL